MSKSTMRQEFFVDGFKWMYDTNPNRRIHSTRVNHYGTANDFTRWNSDGLIEITKRSTLGINGLKFVSFRFTDKSKALFEFINL